MSTRHEQPLGFPSLHSIGSRAHCSFPGLRWAFPGLPGPSRGLQGPSLFRRALGVWVLGPGTATTNTGLKTTDTEATKPMTAVTQTKVTEAIMRQMEVTLRPVDFCPPPSPGFFWLSPLLLPQASLLGPHLGCSLALPRPP